MKRLKVDNISNKTYFYNNNLTKNMIIIKKIQKVHKNKLIKYKIKNKNCRIYFSKIKRNNNQKLMKLNKHMMTLLMNRTRK